MSFCSFTVSAYSSPLLGDDCFIIINHHQVRETNTHFVCKSNVAKVSLLSSSPLTQACFRHNLDILWYRDVVTEDVACRNDIFVQHVDVLTISHMICIKHRLWVDMNSEIHAHNLPYSKPNDSVSVILQIQASKPMLLRKHKMREASKSAKNKSRSGF